MERGPVRRGGRGGAARFVVAGVLAAAVGTWGGRILSEPSPSTGDAPAPLGGRPDGGRASDPAAWWRATEEAAADEIGRGMWYAALARLTAPESETYAPFAPPDLVPGLEASILRAAARGERGGSYAGLRGVVRRALPYVDDPSSTPSRREVARRVVRWAGARVLDPYGADRERFGRTYRALRVGRGDLDRAPDAPLRRYRFDEAADRLDPVRNELRTWLVERRVVRTCAVWRGLAETWADTTSALGARWDGPAGRDAAALVADAAEGAEVRFDAGDPPDEEGFGLVVVDGSSPRRCVRVRWCDLPPGLAARAVVLPRLGDLEPHVVAGLARLYAELCEPGIAAACRAEARLRGAAADADLDAEIEALVALESVAGRTMPASVEGDARLRAWSERWAATSAAHLVRGRDWGAVGEIGPEALETWLEDGLLWAPEQWRLRCERLAAAREETLGQRKAHAIESDHFDVVTDVSAEFAADASLVLDAAWEQAELVLGVTPRGKPRAVVYSREEDYRNRFRDRSGGVWVHLDASLYTYVGAWRPTRFSAYPHSILVHEAAHAVLGTSLRSRPPAWLTEGVACYFERWDPTRSVAQNRRETAGVLHRRKSLLRAQTERVLPDLEAFLGLRTEWDADDFGTTTLGRYAMAESLFVHLMDDPVRRRIVDGFLRDVACGRDPEDALSRGARGRLERSWRESVGLRRR